MILAVRVKEKSDRDPYTLLVEIDKEFGNQADLIQVHINNYLDQHRIDYKYYNVIGSVQLSDLNLEVSTNRG